MPSYCLKCKKTTGIINPRVSKIKNSKTKVVKNQNLLNKTQKYY